MSRFRNFYSYDLNQVVNLIRREGVKKVLIQLPDGIKPFATEILEELRNEVKDVEFTIDANPVYGPCILNNNVARYYDIVLHFGHYPYPYHQESNVKVAYIELLSTLGLDDNLLNKLLNTLHSISAKSVAIYTVQQHINVIDHLIRFLTKYDVKVANASSRGYAYILGCWFNDALRYVNECDCYIVVSGGRFHSLGLGLHVGGMKSIIHLDIYRGEVKAVNDVVNHYLRVRYGKLMESLDSRSWLVIHGIEGQYRKSLRDELVIRTKDKGIKVYEAQTHIINYDILRNLDVKDVDTYVITACPRLPIDDLADFEKPVLTPGEAFMILNNNLNNYVFPW